jgi:hypothetical protein
MRWTGNRREPRRSLIELLAFAAVKLPKKKRREAVRPVLAFACTVAIVALI